MKTNAQPAKALLASLNDRQILDLLTSKTPLGLARGAFTHNCAKIEQAQEQTRAPSAIDTRRMEFDAVFEICDKLGIDPLGLLETALAPKVEPEPQA